MVAHVQPWMLIPIVPLIIMFEGAELSYDTVLYYKQQYAPVQVALLIVCGGLLAFCMEMSGTAFTRGCLYRVNTHHVVLEYLLLVNTSGITLNIFGIVKEVATLLLAHLLNNDHLSTVNVGGLVLCLCGMTLHGMSRRRQR
ncbi:unnamed protein product [Cylicostephanus goldi]|uniref:Sugar phosphate transporter domain-containing protein n=1 Tax=Cylicostephanus goldi TaxID=71465 RepID=A0A3P6T1P4_CYLGO|nr:unnamed protein product [Cylicostephanus goldi]